MDAIRAFAADGGSVVGIGNGFQLLTEAGLLPGAQQENRGLKSFCTSVDVRVESTDSALTNAGAVGDVLRIPINHFEGKATTPSTPRRWRRCGPRVLPG